MNEQQIITDTQWGERCSVKLDKLLFSTLQKLQIPTIIFINKIDRAGVNLERLGDFAEGIARFVVRSEETVLDSELLHSLRIEEMLKQVLGMLEMTKN